MSTDSAHCLFVYGTLRSESTHPMARLLRRHADLVGTSTAQGKLYRIASYCGMTPSCDARDRVYGEVYKLRRPKNLLSALDRYEGRRFKRQSVRVSLGNGKRLMASAWIYRGPVRPERRVLSGKW